MLKTVAEIAEIYGVSKSAVYKWLDGGLSHSTEKVIGYKPRKMIDTDDVDKYLQVGIKE